MTCSSCKTDLAEHSRFCHACGAQAVGVKAYVCLPCGVLCKDKAGTPFRGDHGTGCEKDPRYVQAVDAASLVLGSDGTVVAASHI